MLKAMGPPFGCFWGSGLVSAPFAVDLWCQFAFLGKFFFIWIWSCFWFKKIMQFDVSSSKLYTLRSCSLNFSGSFERKWRISSSGERRELFDGVFVIAWQAKRWNLGEFGKGLVGLLFSVASNSDRNSEFGFLFFGLVGWAASRGKLRMCWNLLRRLWWLLGLQRRYRGLPWCGL